MKSKNFNIKLHGFIFLFPFQVFFSLIPFSFCSCILRIPSVIYYMLSFHPLQNSLKINVKDDKKIHKYNKKTNICCTIPCSEIMPVRQINSAN